MPTFEMVVLMKKLQRPDLKSALMRTARYIFEVGGVIRRIDNMGFKTCPYRVKGNDGRYKEAHYFVYNFDSSQIQLNDLRDKCKRDVDMIRQTIFLIEDKLDFAANTIPECDIHLDMLDVPFRPHVQQMVEISKRKKKKPFVYGGGRTFDPLSK